MSNKAAFLDMLNVADTAGDDGTNAFQTLFGNLMPNVNILQLFQKPAIQRLLASDAMRDAIEASDIPALQALYARSYERQTEDRSYNFGYNSAYYVTIGVPVLLLTVIFTYLMWRILTNVKTKEVTREEKKRLKQLKKENAEAQRRLQLTKRTPRTGSPK